MTNVAGPSASTSSPARPDKFEEAQFLRDLVNLRDTQEAIQSLSTWCLKNRRAAYKIARCWVKVVKKTKPEQKLTLFYLMNDVVQHSKRKNATELLAKCQGVLKEAMPYLKQDTMGNKTEKILRVLNIWSERQVFEENFVSELKAILDPSRRNDQEIVDNFQPQQLCTQLKILKALEDDTDYKHKTLKDNDVDLIDVEALRHSLKDRQHGNDFINNFEEGQRRMEQYIKALEREISKRRQVVDLLSNGSKYYDSLFGEASIVAKAYNNFGTRVKTQKEKLKEMIPKMDEIVNISPIPSPPAHDVPSPRAEDEMELELPEDSHPVAPIEVNEPPASRRNETISGDLNTRLESMLENGTSASNQKPEERVTSDGNDFSISEYLTKIASGEIASPNNQVSSTSTQNNFNWQTQQEASVSWPEPRHASQQEEPIPEWKIQPVDEEPPEEVVFQNTALDRLKRKRVSEKNSQNLISLTEQHSNGSGDNQADGQISLQERLRNLAGTPVADEPMTYDSPLNFEAPPPSSNLFNNSAQTLPNLDPNHVQQLSVPPPPIMSSVGPEQHAAQDNGGLTNLGHLPPLQHHYQNEMPPGNHVPFKQQQNNKQHFQGPRGRFDSPRPRFDSPRPRFDHPRPRFENPRSRFDGPRQHPPRGRGFQHSPGMGMRSRGVASHHGRGSPARFRGVRGGPRW